MDNRRSIKFVDPKLQQQQKLPIKKQPSAQFEWNFKNRASSYYYTYSYYTKFI